MESQKKIKMALDMLGATISYYNDGGSSILDMCCSECEDGVVDYYNEALSVIKRDYTILNKTIRAIDSFNKEERFDE